MCSFVELIDGGVRNSKERRTGLKTRHYNGRKRAGAPDQVPEMLGAGGAGDSGTTKSGGFPTGWDKLRPPLRDWRGIEPRSKVE